jgi:hypothetical protein
MADDKVTSRQELEAAVGDKEVHEEAMAQLKAETDHATISEKKVLLKTDLHVVPILFLLFLCAVSHSELPTMDNAIMARILEPATIKYPGGMLHKLTWLSVH